MTLWKCQEAPKGWQFLHWQTPCTAKKSHAEPSWGQNIPLVLVIWKGIWMMSEGTYHSDCTNERDQPSRLAEKQQRSLAIFTSLMCTKMLAWCTDVHCDFGIQWVSLHVQYMVGKWVQTIKAHCIPCVCNSVKPTRKKRSRYQNRNLRKKNWHLYFSSTPSLPHLTLPRLNASISLQAYNPLQSTGLAVCPMLKWGEDRIQMNTKPTFEGWVHFSCLSSGGSCDTSRL